MLPAAGLLRTVFTAGGSLLPGPVPKLSTTATSLASCPGQSVQGQGWRKEVQCYLLFKVKIWLSCAPGSLSHSAPWEADMVEPDGQSRSQEGDQDLGWVMELLEQLSLLTPCTGDVQG